MSKALSIVAISAGLKPLVQYVNEMGDEEALAAVAVAPSPIAEVAARREIAANFLRG